MALRHTSMLEVNEFLVRDFIRGQERTTRPEIAQALGLSASSVSRMVARLERAGLVVELPGTSSAAGRPPGLICFNHSAGAVVAVDLGGTRCHGALADLSGTILVEDVRATRGEGGAYAALSGTIETLLEAAQQRELPVAALTVGIAAILDPATGIAVGGPHVEWQGFEVVRKLRQLVDVPFLVENDANLAALAHAWRGDGRDLDNFVAVTIGTGIGAAVVTNGQLVKGRHNAAGEVGYLVVGHEQLRHRLDGGIGGFEAVASGPAIAQRATELLARTRAAGDGPAEGSGPFGDREITAELVFAAAAANDPLGRQVIDELLDWVALALIAVVTTVDPELIILEGRVGRSLRALPGRDRSPNGGSAARHAAAFRVASRAHRDHARRHRRRAAARAPPWRPGRAVPRVRRRPEGPGMSGPRLVDAGADTQARGESGRSLSPTELARLARDAGRHSLGRADADGGSAAFLVADLGATHLQIAIAAAGAVRPIAVHRTADLSWDPVNGIAPAVVEGLVDAWAQSDGGREQPPAGVGIGVAAYVARDGSILQRRPFGIMAGPTMRDRAAEALGCGVVVDNDANLAALGEQYHGAGLGCGDFLLLTLGTNIGLGIVSNGQILRGAHGAAGEAGFLLIPARRGRSGTAAMAHAGRLGAGHTTAPKGYAWLKDLTGGGALARSLGTEQRVFVQAMAGDRRARTVVRHAIEGWAALIADLVALFDPACIILSGGLVEDIRPFMGPLRRRAAELSPLPPDIRIGELGALAGLVGAAEAARTAASAVAANHQAAHVGVQVIPQPTRTMFK